MLQNMKVDIVYYKTNTDFEMEFNLCGCCRMRLLNDKASNKKIFVHKLARAVSRSKVIIIIGSLFGEDSIINLAAEAISKKIETVDNKAYGISGDDQIQVISGSSPLTTPEGYFGGCIIESGPQTMILLTESKSIRKKLMNTLIHPYISDLCIASDKTNHTERAELSKDELETDNNLILDLDTEAMVEEQVDTPLPTVESEDILTNNDYDIVADNSNEQTEDEIGLEPILENLVPDISEVSDIVDIDPEEISKDPLVIDEEEGFETFEPNENDIMVSSDMIFEDEYDEKIEIAEETEDSPDYIFDQEKPKRVKKQFDMDDFEDVSDLVTEDFSYPKKSKFNPLNLSILIVTIILLIAIAVLCYCIFYIPLKDGSSASAFIKETFTVLFGQS